MNAIKIIKYGLEVILGTSLVVGNLNQAKAPVKEENFSIEVDYNPKISKSLIDENTKDFVKKLELIVSVGRSKKYVDDYYKMNPNTPFEKEYIFSTIFGESRGEIFARSKTGALGLMQNMKPSWVWIEPSKKFEEYAYEPISSIDVGVKLLSWFENYCEKKCPTWNELDSIGKMKLVSACYNTGQRKVKDSNWDVDKTNPDTKEYVNEDVLWAYNELKKEDYLENIAELYSWALKILKKN